MICTFFFFKNGELMATCDICGEFFANVFALGAHKRRCWNLQARVLSDFSQISSSGDDEFSDDYLPEIGIVSTATLADSEARAIPILQMLQDDNALMNLATRAEDATSRITDCRIQQTDDLRQEFAVSQLCADAKAMEKARERGLQIVSWGLLAGIQIRSESEYEVCWRRVEDS